MEGAPAGAGPALHPDSLSPTAVCSFWQEFDLEGLRGTLDAHGLAVAGHQESSVASRKALAERTKEFRRGLAPDAFKQVGPLLKLYQEEVDRLTGRAKAGEAAFLDVFKRLYEAPDPAPAIAAGLELGSRAAELEAAAAKTARELADFKAESRALKNQALTVRRLEERVRVLEGEVAERGAEAEAARAAAAAELEARSEEESRAREARLAEELDRAQAGMEALRRMHQATQSQLFSVQERGEEAAAAARAEADFATEEVERAQQQLGALQQERDALVRRLKEGGGGGRAGGEAAAAAAAAPDEEAALREELRAQRELASRAAAEAAGAAARGAADAAAAAARLAAAQAALDAKEAHCAALEAELSGRPTQAELEEARQATRVLRAVVHHSLDGDDEGGGAPGGAGPLEAALLGKNRHLEHKLTMARLEVAEARGEEPCCVCGGVNQGVAASPHTRPLARSPAGEAEAAAARASELESELERARALVAQLEEHLSAADPAAAAAAAAAPPPPGGPSEEGGGLDHSINSGSLAAGGGEQTMVSVLVAQRDRFKARILELEGGAAAAAAALTRARTEVEAARADNVSLVERMRYVQGYAAGGAGVGAAAPGAAAAAAASASDLEAGAGVLGKYMRQYEDRVNPFSDFRARELQARRRQMPLQDRAAFAVGSALVGGSRAARSAIVIYALALHFVAFLVLAGCVAAPASRHVPAPCCRRPPCCRVTPAAPRPLPQVFAPPGGQDRAAGGAVCAGGRRGGRRPGRRRRRRGGGGGH
jgi:homeobox protein cut-like